MRAELSATFRRPTALTPVLQVALPASFALDQFLVGIQIWNSVSSRDRPSWIPTFVFVLLISGLLALGSFRRWTWTFWVFLIFLGLGAAGDVIALFGRGPNWFLYNSSIVLLRPVLFGACVYSLIRYGPWAQVSLPRVPPDPLAPPPDKYRQYY
jgi:hypothetical protein